MLSTYTYTCSAGGRETRNPGAAAETFCINNSIIYTGKQTQGHAKMTIVCDESDISDIGSPVGSPQSDDSPGSGKHVPHCEKAPHLVARRNARERRRVQAVNSAFSCLRRHVPYENRHKRLSKVKTLRYAIDYIKNLKDMLEKYDGMCSQPSQPIQHKVPMVELTSSRENNQQQRWVPLDLTKMMQQNDQYGGNNNNIYPHSNYGPTSY